jgi:hypothetical protein
VSKRQPDYSSIQPDRKNANKGTERGRYMVEASLRETGAGRSILLDKDGRIIAGNKTFEAASDIGLPVRIVQTDGSELVAVQRTDLDLDDDTGTARKLAYYDNRAGQVGLEWDAEQVLADVSAGLDLSAMFKQDELDEMLADLQPKATGDTEAQIDRAEELRQKWGVKSGDLWSLGDHRLIVGDCTDPATVARVMGGERAQAVVTDPPYGMNLDASYKNSVDNPTKGIKASRGYAPVIGDDKDYDPRPLLEMFGDVAEHFWWGGDYYADKLPRGGSWLVWDKRATIEELQYSSSEFELCWSKTPHHRHILRVPWFGLIGTEQQDTQKRLHPTQKPLGVIAPLLEYVPVGGIVCDFYGGSGTTLIAAENTGRRARVCEVSAEYCAVILERWSTHTQRTPTLVAA